MKRVSLALSLALSLAAIAALQAQNPPAPKAAGGDRVTVTGCFERAVRNPALETGTSGASGTSGAGTSDPDAPMIKADTKWVLTQPSARTDEMVGTSGHPPKIAYRLDIADESNYAAHEGHKVQVSGTVEEGQAASAGEKDARRGAGHAPKLKVESVKMLSENCTR